MFNFLSTERKLPTPTVVYCAAQDAFYINRFRQYVSAKELERIQAVISEGVDYIIREAEPFGPITLEQQLRRTAVSKMALEAALAEPFPTVDVS